MVCSFPSSSAGSRLFCCFSVPSRTQCCKIYFRSSTSLLRLGNTSNRDVLACSSSVRTEPLMLVNYFCATYCDNCTTREIVGIEASERAIEQWILFSLDRQSEAISDPKRHDRRIVEKFNSSVIDERAKSACDSLADGLKFIQQNPLVHKLSFERRRGENDIEWKKTHTEGKISRERILK